MIFVVILLFIKINFEGFGKKYIYIYKLFILLLVVKLFLNGFFGFLFLESMCFIVIYLLDVGL